MNREFATRSLARASRAGISFWSTSVLASLDPTQLPALCSGPASSKHGPDASTPTVAGSAQLTYRVSALDLARKPQTLQPQFREDASPVQPWPNGGRGRGQDGLSLKWSCQRNQMVPRQLCLLLKSADKPGSVPAFPYGPEGGDHLSGTAVTRHL